MEINVNDERKMVEFWLSRDEQSDSALLESLKPQYKKYAEKKYLVAVFQSGKRDLCEATADLLCYNRTRLAQKEIAAERQQAMNGTI